MTDLKISQLTAVSSPALTDEYAIAQAGVTKKITGTQIQSLLVPSAYGCRVHRASGNVALGNNTWTVVGFDAEDYDATGSMHDNSTNPSRIVIPSIGGVTTGLWAMWTHGYSNATSGRTDIMFRANANTVNNAGTQIAVFVSGPIAASGVGPSSGYAEWVLSAGDYIEVFYRSTGGTFSLLYDAGGFLPMFGISFRGKMT